MMRSIDVKFKFLTATVGDARVVRIKCLGVGA
jgi:hypothetical protein